MYCAPTTKKQLNVSEDVFMVVRDRCDECVGEYRDMLCDENSLCEWFVRHARKLQEEFDKESV